MKKTKVVATIGPSSAHEEGITRMIEAGVDVFRFNMKHNVPDWHSAKMTIVERVCNRLDTRVAMLLDLQGPEIRVHTLPGGKSSWTITNGSTVQFCKPGADGIALDHPEVFSQIKKGQIVYADDGLLEFRLKKVTTNYADAEVVEGGVLKVRKTVNFPGASFDFPTLIDQDLKSLSLAARHHVDFIALSFVRNAEDIAQLRKEMKRFDIDANVIAKIEHPDAVQNFNDILLASDGIMVARGDLGIEYPMEEVPEIQKRLIRISRSEGRPVIIATQMLESMVDHIRPTRAEVSDVANAVYDSADAVMLSTETASGKYPVRAVETMGRIAGKVDSVIEHKGVDIDWERGGQTAAVVAAAYQLMKFGFKGICDIQAFIALTETGTTVQYLSRQRPELPILALSGNKKTLDQLKLSWGVVPIYYDYSKQRRLDTLKVVNHLADLGFVDKGKNAIMIYGQILGKPGLTSVVRLQYVPE